MTDITSLNQTNRRLQRPQFMFLNNMKARKPFRRPQPLAADQPRSNINQQREHRHIVKKRQHAMQQAHAPHF